MRIIITGGAGFIGQKLSYQLKSMGHEVIIVDNFNPKIHLQPERTQRKLADEFETIQLDITERWSDFLPQNVDWIFHFASETGTGESMYNTIDYVSTNLVGTSRLAEFWTSLGDCGVTLASSRSLYGNGCASCDLHGLYYIDELGCTEPLFKKSPMCPICAKELQFVASRENDKPQPMSVYATTKLTQELLLKNVSNGRNLSIFRFQNVYGPGQALHNPYTGILAIFLNRLISGKCIEIFEQGRPVRDFVHVDDVVGIVSSSFSGISGCVNLGSGEVTSVLDVASHYCDLLAINQNKMVKMTDRFRVGDVFHCRSDNQKLLSIIGNYEFKSFEDGIKGFFEYARNEIEDGISLEYEKSLKLLEKSGLMRGNEA